MDAPDATDAGYTGQRSVTNRGESRPTMRLVASGTVFDTRFAPANEKSASATGALLASDGTLFVTFRLGTERESGDGHEAVMASTDLGETWQLRHLGLNRGVLDGVRGETRSFLLAELT